MSTVSEEKTTTITEGAVRFEIVEVRDPESDEYKKPEVRLRILTPEPDGSWVSRVIMDEAAAASFKRAWNEHISWRIKCG